MPCFAFKIIRIRTKQCSVFVIVANIRYKYNWFNTSYWWDDFKTFIYKNRWKLRNETLSFESVRYQTETLGFLWQHTILKYKIAITDLKRKNIISSYHCLQYVLITSITWYNHHDLCYTKQHLIFRTISLLWDEWTTSLLGDETGTMAGFLI